MASLPVSDADKRMTSSRPFLPSENQVCQQPSSHQHQQQQHNARREVQTVTQNGTTDISTDTRCLLEYTTNQVCSKTATLPYYTDQCLRHSAQLGSSDSMARQSLSPTSNHSLHDGSLDDQGKLPGHTFTNIDVRSKCSSFNSGGWSRRPNSRAAMVNGRSNIPISQSTCIVRSNWLFSRSVGLVAVLSCLLALTGYTESRALDVEGRYKKLTADTVKYLAQFGYLKGPSRETQDLRSHEDLTRAIKSLQRAGGLLETGVVDRQTNELMHRPRCGNTDDFMEDERPYDPYNSGYKIRKKRYTTSSSKWPRTNLTFRFINYTPDMPQHKTREIIQNAFKVWSDETPLSFTEVRQSRADIMIQFASKYHSDGYPFDGQGMVLAHAFFPGSGKGGDTHFDDDESWVEHGAGNGVDLFMVAAHEFGHALGLAHSGDQEALMYPWYIGFEGQFKLPLDDRRGITSLYGSGDKDPTDGVKLIPNHHTPEDPVIIDEEDKNREEEDGPADPCSSHFDAVSFIRNEIFIFIGKKFWRLDSRRILLPGTGTDIHQMFYQLPANITKIDAVYDRRDSKNVFFSGDRYWVFNGNHLDRNFPSEGRSLTDFNIPADVKHIDAAFVWGYNNRTYLVSGDMYWKMNENNTFVEYDYPRDMGTWKGVPVPLDAAYTDLQGKTYFFQGPDFWEFYDLKMRVRRGFPKRSYKYWLNCKEPPNVDKQGPGRVQLSGGGQRQPNIEFKNEMESSGENAAQQDTKKDPSKNSGSMASNLCNVLVLVVCVLNMIVLQQ